MFLDPSQTLFTKSIDISFNEIFHMSEQGDLNIYPKYKIGLVWSKEKKGRFIESALLGLPLNGFVFEEDDYGNFSVVDGSERLSSVIEFFKGSLLLSGLTVLRQLNGTDYSGLDYSIQTKLRRTVCGITVLDRESHSSLKCEYFKRINIGKNGFVPQQARNFAYPKAHEIMRDGRDYLAKYFNFRISEKSYGSRKFNSILKEEHFILCLSLLEFLREKKNFYSSDFLLGNVLDDFSQEIENSDYSRLSRVVRHNIRNFPSQLNIGNLNLVNRSYNYPKLYPENEVSMNDFLLFCFATNFHLPFDNSSSNFKFESKLDLKFDFFDENTPIYKLLRYI